MPNARTLDAENFFTEPRPRPRSRRRPPRRSDGRDRYRRDGAGPLFATYSKNPDLPFDNEARLARRSALEAPLADEIALARQWVEAPGGEPAGAALEEGRCSLCPSVADSDPGPAAPVRRFRDPVEAAQQIALDLGDVRIPDVEDEDRAHRRPSGSRPHARSCRRTPRPADLPLARLAADPEGAARRNDQRQMDDRPDVADTRYGPAGGSPAGAARRRPSGVRPGRSDNGSASTAAAVSGTRAQTASSRARPSTGCRAPQSSLWSSGAICWPAFPAPSRHRAGSRTDRPRATLRARLG